MSDVALQRFQAPGKLVLVGEYAVLDGAPAIVAAIDHGVRCLAMTGPGARTVECPGDPGFVNAALSAAHAPGGHYVFRDHEVAPTGSKPGFGSSAAATVVAVYAARALRGALISAQEAFDIAFPVHRRVQGSGSGIDIAASAWGGVLRFQRNPTETAPVPFETPKRRGAVVRPLPEVRPVVVWSGQSAPTGPRVAAYEGWIGRPAFARACAPIADRFVEDPVGAMREAWRRLSGMAEAAGIEYRTPTLDRIVDLAESLGGGAKPSGAGGGDCAVALFPDADRETAFVAACEREGLLVIPVQVAPGVRALSPEEPQ